MAMFDKHKGARQSSPQDPEPQVTPPPPAASKAPAVSSDKVAMIGRGIRIAGDVTADSDLKVEGVIEGRSIDSEHDVEIGESGKVVANVSARVVRIAGELAGDVSGSEKVLIAKSGRVQGNVVAPRVQLEDGALFRGSIDMNPAPATGSRKAGAKSSAKPTVAATDAGAVRKEAGLSLKSG